MPRRTRVVQIGAWGLVLAGIVGFAMTGLGVLREIHGAQARRAALGAGPPDAAAVETFDRSAPRNALEEVKLSGQLDVAMQYDLLVAGAIGGRQRRGVMIPLYPHGAVDPATPALGVLIYDQGPGGETISAREIDALVAQIDGEGGLGPIVSLGGTLRNSTPFDALIADRFARDGRSLAADFLRIAPFRGSRAQALSAGPQLEQPVGTGLFAAILMLSGMILLARARNRLRLQGETAQTGAVARAGLAGPDAADAGAHASSGRVEIAAYSPEMADGSCGTALMREVLALGPMAGGAPIYSSPREAVDDFAALDSGGLKRPLAGRGVPEKLAGPKPVKKASPLAGKQDPTAAADILAAVQAQFGRPAETVRKDGTDGDAISLAVRAAVADQPIL